MLKNKKGFTLIEIVIVIVIIAILAAILVPSITKWVDKAKLSNVQSATEQVRGAIVSQLYEKAKDGVTISNTTSDDTSIYDDAFWKAVSDKANTDLHHNNPDANGYTSFTISGTDQIDITFKMSGHTATYENNVWTVE